MTPMIHAASSAAARFLPAFTLADDIRLAPEQPRHLAAREALLDEALGAARGTKTSERLREGRLPAQGLAFVALDGEDVVGTLRLWHINAGGAPALLLGPLAVAESHRSLGLGGKLIRHALASAALRGHRCVLLVGDAPYYARFGFEAKLTRALSLPGPVDRARFLGFEIAPGALAGARGMIVATGARSGRRDGVAAALAIAA